MRTEYFIRQRLRGFLDFVVYRSSAKVFVSKRNGVALASSAIAIAFSSNRSGTSKGKLYGHILALKRGVATWAIELF